jgi:hypothetical protein
MIERKRARCGGAARWLLLGLAVVALNESSAQAEPVAAPASAREQDAATSVGLQSPDQRSTRFSAYSLQKHTWSIEAGALGVNGEELYGRLGVGYGFGGGFQVDANLMHWSVGLFDLEARWTFLDTRYIALAASVAGAYGHGDWMWFLAPAAKQILSDTNLVAIPIGLAASAPLTRWLQADLQVEYQYSQLSGTLGNGSSFYATSQLGARQFRLRPGVRFFLSDATAFEVAAKLPLYTQVPAEVESTVSAGNQTQSGSHSAYKEVKFKDAWNLEGGLRSRLRPWLYATVRLHYGRVAKALYGCALYPSFGLEFRL